MMLVLERILRRFPRWVDFAQEPPIAKLSVAQADDISKVAQTLSHILRAPENQIIVDPIVPDALDELSAKLDAATSRAEALPDPIELGKELLAQDVLESVNNTMKRISECALAVISLARAAPVALISAGLLSPAFAGAVDAPDAARTHQFPWGSFKLAPRIVDLMKAGEPAKIVVGVTATAIPHIGTEMRAGMERGCSNPDNGIQTKCSLTGPVNADANKQLSQLETMLHANAVDCLVLQSPLPGQFVRVIDEFVNAGIPVFTFNIDVDKSRRFAFAALDEEQAGAVNGEATAKLIKEKNLKIDTVAMGSSAPNEAWARSRMVGFAAGYKKVIPDAKFFNDADHAVPTGNTYSVKEALTTVTPFLTAHPEVNLFFHTVQGIEGVGDVIQNLELQGKVLRLGLQRQ